MEVFTQGDNQMKHIAKRKKTVCHKVRIVKGTACKDGKEYKSWTHYEYDSKGKIRHLAKFDGYEKWYDTNGNVIHEKCPTGVEHWYDYDADGHLIHEQNFDYEYWYEYDADGNVIHEKHNNGYEIWNEYDADSNLTHAKDSDGFEQWHEYDSKGNLIHEKNTTGYERWCNTTYKKIKGKSLIEWDLST